MAEKLLKAAEVAHILGCSTGTVRQLHKAGQIPAVRFGERGHLRFVPEDIERLIERRERRDDAHTLAAA